jgi:hypothetical protein
MKRSVMTNTLRRVVLPPPGWRELRSGETIEQGDRFWGSDPPCDSPALHRALSIGWTPADNACGYRYFRRRNKSLSGGEPAAERKP